MNLVNEMCFAFNYGKMIFIFRSNKLENVIKLIVTFQLEHNLSLDTLKKIHLRKKIYDRSTPVYTRESRKAMESFHPILYNNTIRQNYRLGPCGLVFHYSIITWT